MHSKTEQITRWLNEIREGNDASADQLLEAVYSDLRGIARHFMAGERPDHTLQPTALVHEAYLRIFAGSPAQWQNRTHFFAVAASQMHRVLVDHGREFRAAKRGFGLKVALEEGRHASPLAECDIETVDELLERLQRVDAQAARLLLQCREVHACDCRFRHCRHSVLLVVSPQVARFYTRASRFRSSARWKSP
jgi:RNA polymerase sigma factor (TIGR02999 family)